nr:hypothetical protein CFP56_79454 [Quercus suber]
MQYFEGDFGLWIVVSSQSAMSSNEIYSILWLFVEPIHRVKSATGLTPRDGRMRPHPAASPPPSRGLQLTPPAAHCHSTLPER